MKRTHVENSEKGARREAVKALHSAGYQARMADYWGVCRCVYFRGNDEAVFDVSEAGVGKWKATIRTGRPLRVVRTGDDGS